MKKRCSFNNNFKKQVLEFHSHVGSTVRGTARHFNLDPATVKKREDIADLPRQLTVHRRPVTQLMSDLDKSLSEWVLDKRKNYIGKQFMMSY